MRKFRNTNGSAKANISNQIVENVKPKYLQTEDTQALIIGSSKNCEKFADNSKHNAYRFLQEMYGKLTSNIMHYHTFKEKCVAN